MIASVNVAKITLILIKLSINEKIALNGDKTEKENPRLKLGIKPKIRSKKEKNKVKIDSKIILPPLPSHETTYKNQSESQADKKQLIYHVHKYQIQRIY